MNHLRHWNSANGERFDTTLVGATTDPEVSLETPVGAPAILHNPILLTSVRLAVADNEHGVVGDLEWIERIGVTLLLLMRVDTTMVAHKVRVDFESNRHGSILDQVEHYEVFIARTIIPTNVFVRVGVCLLVATVHRGIDRPALSIGTLVRVAGVGNDTIVLGVLAGDQIREATIAALRVARAIDHILGRENRLLGVVRQDAHTSLEHGHRSKRIATATPALVAHGRDIVDTVDVTPIERLWQQIQLLGQNIILCCWFGTAIQLEISLC